MFRLGKITKDMNPHGLYKLISRLKKTNYFLLKFGFSKESFQNILDHPDINITSIKNNIKIIMHDTRSAKLTPELIIVSLIKSNPMHQAILNNMRLSLEDLYDGIRITNEKNKIFLGENQILALDNIKRFLARDGKHIFLIGNDSSGKTYLSNNLIPDSELLDAHELIKLSRQRAESVLSSYLKSKTKEILIIDNSEKLLEESINSRDYSDLFDEEIVKNKKIIMIFDSDKYNSLINRLPKELSKFRIIKINQFTNEEAIRILYHWSDNIEQINKITITYNALKFAYDMSAKTTKGRLSVSNSMKIIEEVINIKKSGQITAQDISEHLEYLNKITNRNNSLMSYFIFKYKDNVDKLLNNLEKNNEDYLIHALDMQNFDSLDFEDLFEFVNNYPKTILHLQNIDKVSKNVLLTIHQILDDKVYQNGNQLIDFSDIIFVGSSEIDEVELSKYLDLGYDISKLQNLFTANFELQNLIGHFDTQLFLIQK